MINRLVIPFLALSVLMVGVSLADDSTKDVGQTHYNNWCSHCHSTGQVASRFLEKRYEGEHPGSLEARTDLTKEFVMWRVRTAIQGMPAFRPTELSDYDLELIAAYLGRQK